MNVLCLPDPLLTVVATALILMAWLKIPDTIANISPLRKREEQELTFLLVASASVSKTRLELAEMLRYTANAMSSRALKRSEGGLIS